MKKLLNTVQTQKLKVFFARLVNIIIVAATLAAGIAVGYYSREIRGKSDVISETILQNEIRIAVDSEDKLILMDRKTGHYTIYSDSIGKTIFHIYAKKIVE
jgi:hypothetical protein